MSQVITAPLVGMHFRPPAKAVLAHLPSGASLILVPEPENPYDEKAIKVLVSPDQVPASQYDGLAADLVGMGLDLDEVLQTKSEVKEPIWLGFIADSDGKVCKQRPVPTGNREVGALLTESGMDRLVCTLAFEPDGKPVVQVGVKI
jgi:hypothetical protein